MAAKLPPFGELRPELLSEWIHDQNPYDAANVSAGSPFLAFWRCKSCQHEWKARVSNRCRLGHGCPRCAGVKIDASQSIATLHPEMMEFWHRTKNAHLDPSTISAGSKERAWWKCKVCDHEWESYVFNKAKKGVGCPKCSGQFASEHNCLENLYPEIAAELHPTKNGILTGRSITGKSGQKVWWICPLCLNEYDAKVVNRTHRGSGCPLCASDSVGRQTAERLAAEEADSFLDYSYDADTQILEQHREIQAAFRNYLNIEPDPRSIDSLLSPRVKTRINYSPYYQRNYVWDTTKATYFIESILLGTEIPPLIFFDVNQAFEVIDGRQRFETILRFCEGKFALNRAGLHALKSLADKTFLDLPTDLQTSFLDTAIRIVKFRLVDSQRCNDLTQDLIKKEVFRRYNSGITPLRRIDVNRAVYIKDSITDHFKKQLKRNRRVFQAIVRCFMAESDRDKVDHPDTLEKACQVVRDLLISAETSVISA